MNQLEDDLKNPLISGKTFRMDMLNPNILFKSLKGGDRHILQIEITEEMWNYFRAIDTDGRAGMCLAASVQVAESPDTKKHKGISSSDEPKPEKKEKTLSQQAYSLCHEENFQKYAYNIWPSEGGAGAKHADMYIKLKCVIDSKGELDTFGPAARAFWELVEDFRIWVQDGKPAKA